MTDALVIRTTGSWYRLLLPDGSTLDGRLRGNYRLRGNKQTNPVAVGDRVDYALQPDGTALILDVHDRRNYIVRRATKLSKQTHVIAANIDLLCIVATLGLPRTSTGFIDRLLVTAEAYHIPAALLFNKVDLYGQPGSELWQAHNELKAIYTAAGYPVLEVSALQGTGIDNIKALIAGKTVLFSGHSGVGKSALLNAISPGLGLKVGQISDWSLKGRHTTTFAEIIPVESGKWKVESKQEQQLPTLHNDTRPGAAAELSTPHSPLSTFHSPLSTFHSPLSTYLIDTPGIKEFGMVDFTAQELSHFFPEMRAVLHDCRFANCTHRHEPGCAVKQAVDDGRISPERYQNYLSILDDLQ